MENGSETKEIQYALLKAQTNYEVLREWIYTNQIGHRLENFFLKRNYRTIALYGVGEIGLLLCNELWGNHEIKIAYAIDQSVENIPFDILVADTYLPDVKVDAVVVTPHFAFKEIKNNLSNAGIDNVISIKEVILGA